MERKKLLRVFEINIFTIKYLDKIPTTSLNVFDTTEPTTSWIVFDTPQPAQAGTRKSKQKISSLNVYTKTATIKREEMLAIGNKTMIKLRNNINRKDINENERPDKKIDIAERILDLDEITKRKRY